jgi:hypothetical protein
MSDDAARSAMFRDFGIVEPTEATYRGALVMERFRKDPDSFNLTPEQRERMQALVDEVDRLLDRINTAMYANRNPFLVK